MGSRERKVEIYLNQQTVFESNGELDKAFTVGSDYFYHPICRAWDNQHERFFRSTIRIAAQIMVPPDSPFFTAIRLSNTNPNNTLGDNIFEYLEMCHQRIKTEIQHAKELKKDCKYPLFDKVNVNKLLYDTVIDHSIVFTFRSYAIILERLYKIVRLEGIFHKVLIKAFEFCKEYKRQEFHQEFTRALLLYRSVIVDPRQEQILRMIKSSLVCYETALSLSMYKRAMMILYNAYVYMQKLKDIPPALEQKIEEEKLNVLLITNNKLYACLQRLNLIIFYENNPNLEMSLTLKQMIDLCVMETVAAPLYNDPFANQQDDNINGEDTSDLYIDFPRFLKQTGDIPTRKELLSRLLRKTAPNTPLYDFVIAAETSKSPVQIARATINLLKAAKTEYAMGRDHFGDLSNYAAIRVLDALRVHFTTISIDEVLDIVTWMKPVQLEALIVHASRFNVLPAHINMATGYITLTPLGNQELMPSLSSLNDQLKTIFDRFQSIKRTATLPKKESATTSGPAVRRTYNTTYNEMNSRMERLQFVVKSIRTEQEMQLERELEEERMLQRQQALEERMKRKEEEEKSRIKRERIEAYDFALAECQILCERLSIDYRAFIHAPASNGLMKKNDKELDSEWAEQKALDLKTKYVKEMRSHADKVAAKMAKVKEGIGRKRVESRLAMKKKLEANSILEREAQLIPALMANHKKAKHRLYKQQVEDFKECVSLVQGTGDAWAAYSAKIAEKTKTERAVRTQAPQGFTPPSVTSGSALAKKWGTSSNPDMDPFADEDEGYPVENEQELALQRAAMVARNSTGLGSRKPPPMPPGMKPAGEPNPMAKNDIVDDKDDKKKDDKEDKTKDDSDDKKKDDKKPINNSLPPGLKPVTGLPPGLKPVAAPSLPPGVKPVPVPAGALPPGLKPVALPPGVKPVPVPPPAGAVPVAKLPPGVKPVALPPGVKPVALPPGVKPVALPPGAVPVANLPPGVKPVALPPGVKPVALPPGAKPVAIPPGVKPVALPPGVKPVQAPPPGFVSAKPPQ